MINCIEVNIGIGILKQVDLWGFVGFIRFNIWVFVLMLWMW